MPQNNRLQFSVEESICFQKGQEVSELLSISLDPDITVQEVNDYVSIRGSLELTGEYNIDQTREYAELPATSRFVEDVKLKGDGSAELTHCFPVDITIPKDKVNHLNDVFVFIDAFDYQLTDARMLTIQADLAIEGLLNVSGEAGEEEPRTMPAAVHPEEELEPAYRSPSNDEDQGEEKEYLIQLDRPYEEQDEEQAEEHDTGEETVPIYQSFLGNDTEEAKPFFTASLSAAERTKREIENQKEASLEQPEEEYKLKREKVEEEPEEYELKREKVEEEPEEYELKREKVEEEPEEYKLKREKVEEEPEEYELKREKVEEEPEEYELKREKVEEEPEEYELKREKVEEEPEEYELKREKVEEEPEEYELKREKVEEEPEEYELKREKVEEEPEEYELKREKVEEEPEEYELKREKVEEEPEEYKLKREKVEEEPEEYELKREEAEEEPELSHSSYQPHEELKENPFYSVPPLLKEDQNDREPEAFEVEVTQEAEAIDEEEEAGHTIEIPEYSFHEQTEPEEERDEMQAADEQEVSAKENDNALYLTKLFTKQGEEEFTRMRMCIVQQNDTIDLLCERYDINVQQLIRMNSLSLDEELKEGQILYIPDYQNSHA
ncbi:MULTISPECIES: LysM peptidoglycan-binding domain-containing protein [unclassified Bacillus (in: firmicutes)]|uniref:LysM peptidoglycan-binding domain-containing protein n=1 Tax=unclassified Bacillus (in: firmicutes) TaxID=185979 RepID=UPI001377B98E|nr:MULTISPECIES: LysM peptidoglycan-binding domain-containing protein [unclassified Bacillus (in: firmicutes)]MBC9088425.1 LysM peptidoglycan-binding domain-containing protein [Bacillus sp. Y1]NBB44598.1 LysM peptidoglycan-binding domain-containing protein [Bacillus sp. y1(2019)]